jgi:MFS family permease
MAHHRQGLFALLGTRRFLPFFLVQFSGAFNDNLYRNALLVLLVSGAVAAERVNLWVNLAAGLFILPFFLFSPLAGQLADRCDKARLMRWIKAAEALIMAGAAAALFQQAWAWLLVLLFAMGAHSSFFGPLKYAIMPQHLGAGDLVAGNALVGMGTFVAILSGTIGGTLLAGGPDPHFWVGGGVVLVALSGWIASLAVPPAPPAAPNLRIDWNPLRQLAVLYRLAAARFGVLPAVAGISVFWALGVSYLTQIPNFAVAVLGGTPALIALLLSAFVVGIAMGSLLCARIGGARGELGLVPLGGLGLALFSLDLGFAVRGFQPLAEAVPSLQLLHQWPLPRVLGDILLLGVCGGLYVVPLYVHLQRRAGSDSRARVIAFNNLLNALFMVAASLLGMLALGVLHWSIPDFFLLLGLLQGLALVLLSIWAPDWLVCLAGWVVGRLWFGVRTLHFPEGRGAETWVLHCPPDPLAVLLAVTRSGRPTRLALPTALRGRRWRWLRRAAPGSAPWPEPGAEEGPVCHCEPDPLVAVTAVAASRHYRLRLRRRGWRVLEVEITPQARPGTASGGDVPGIAAPCAVPGP